MEKKSKLKVLKLVKLSKDSQKEILGGGTVRSHGCETWSCFGAMDAYIIKDTNTFQRRTISPPLLILIQI